MYQKSSDQLQTEEYRLGQYPQSEGTPFKDGDGFDLHSSTLPPRTVASPDLDGARQTVNEIYGPFGQELPPQHRLENIGTQVLVLRRREAERDSAYPQASAA